MPNTYHYTGSRAATNKDEPFFLTKYIVTFVLPEALRAKYGGELLTEQINTIGGLGLDKIPEATEQLYRSNLRRYPGTIIDTTIDLEMGFAVNVDNNNIAYPYNIIRDWVKLIWDPATGRQMPKRDVIGSCTIEMHNKLGDVLRNIYFPIIFPITAPEAFELDYNTEAIYELSVTFAGENPTDLLVGDSQ